MLAEILRDHIDPGTSSKLNRIENKEYRIYRDYQS